MSNFIEKMGREEIFRLKPYVPGKPIEEVQRELGLDNIIKLASNENPLGPSPRAMEAVKEILPKMHYYPDANCFYLKDKLASVYDFAPDHFIIGNGSDELLKLLAETFLSPGDEVIFGQPSFSEYEFTATIMGANCIYVPLNDFKHDLQAMADAINSRTKILYFCNPNNPTGTIVEKAEVDQFMDRIPEDILIIFDEAYVEYNESPDFISGLEYLRQNRNVIVLRTFSKIYGLAALRIGYGITRPEIAAAVDRVTEPFNVNMLAQAAAIAALGDHDHVAASRKMNAAGKAYLGGEFSAMGLKYVPTEANFVFVDTGKNCQDVFKQLLKKGVIVRTGDIFGYPDFIRVTIGSQAENERFISSLKEILGV